MSILVAVLVGMGVSAVVAGVALIHPPSAFIVAGAFLIGAGALNVDDGSGVQ